MKNVLFFLALLLVVTSNLFAGEVANKDTVNNWYFWKAEGGEQDSAWTHLTEDSAISGKSSQVFGLRSFGPTKYFWIKRLDKKYKKPALGEFLIFLDTFTTKKNNNFFDVEIFLGNSENINGMKSVRKFGFSRFDVGIKRPVDFSTANFQEDSLDLIVFCYSFFSSSENVKAQMYIDDFYLVRQDNSSFLIDDGGEPKFARFKTTKPKVNFGAVAQGIKRVDSILVTNAGDAPLVISKIWTDDARFSVACSITTIAPQASTNVVVEFTQDSVSGVKRGKLLVEHNGLSKLDSIELIADFATSVGDENHLPKDFSLSQNYPNPFNPNTTIKYSLESKQYVKLTVYDLLGKEIAVLADGEFSSGEHSAVFNAKNLSSGIYLYRIQAGNFVATKRMMLVK
ncbi:MAG: T9SS type A sorting domain-containing protein [Candidatus Pacebacteria bacterium]|nr:T9SS type A sorting domain-containing protein [Candidatus Paceibacterota bacterium]